MPAFGLAMAAASLVGQNLGAGKPDRAEKLGWVAGHHGAIVTFVLAACLYGLVPKVAGLMLDGKDVPAGSFTPVGTGEYVATPENMATPEMDKLLNSAIGIALLKRLGEAVHPHSFRGTAVQALRSALILSLADDNKLSPVEVISRDGRAPAEWSAEVIVTRRPAAGTVPPLFIPMSPGASA